MTLHDVVRQTHQKQTWRWGDLPLIQKEGPGISNSCTGPVTQTLANLKLLSVFFPWIFARDLFWVGCSEQCLRMLPCSDSLSSPWQRFPVPSPPLRGHVFTGRVDTTPKYSFDAAPTTGCSVFSPHDLPPECIKSPHTAFFCAVLLPGPSFFLSTVYRVRTSRTWFLSCTLCGNRPSAFILRCKA